MAKKTTTKKKKPAAKGPKTYFWQKKSFHSFLGFFLLFIAAFLLMAFLSYFKNWRADQSIISKPFFELMGDPEYRVQNVLGKLGAVTAHQFIHRWFGWASILFVGLFGLLGLRILFAAKRFSIARYSKHMIFYLLWIPTLTAFLFPGMAFSGYIGYQTKIWLVSSIGPWGTGLLLLFLACAFVVISFNISPENIRHQLGRLIMFFKPKQKDVEAEVKEELPIETQPSAERQKEQEAEIKLDLEIASENASKDLMFAADDQKVEADEIIKASKEAVKSSDKMLDISGEIIETAKAERKGAEDDVEMEVQVSEEEEIVEPDAKDLKEFGAYDPTLDLSRYQLPGLDILEEHGSGGNVIDQEELEANKTRIVNTLKDYKIEISKISATVGPTVSLYEIVPAAGVRISKIKNLEDDIALSLSALGIRIIAPIPGKGTIGIEVPRANPNTVSMKAVIGSEKFKNANKMALPIALGRTISNETFVTDLAKMPHLLMAGATGQGKSVGLNAILASILFKKHPSQVKFVLVDPKKVELTLYNKIERHFLAKLPDNEDAIITDTTKVVHTLNSLCIEMDQRYDLLKDAMARNIAEYNKKFIDRKLNPNDGHRYLPYIVLVVDEFADLIMTAGKEVETPIARLAQLARAIGIHLIVATQRPSVNVITGIIKANFPARIAFRVTSKIDSRTILDTGGADQLIGRGDMLLSLGNELIRLQCAFIDTPEVEELCEYIGSQQAYPEAFLLPEYVDEKGEGSGSAMDLDDRDVLFEDAARVVVMNQQGSASLLQRKLKLGYNRAGRIVDQLEAAGIIGPFEGSKARQVLVPDEYALEQLLNTIDQK